MKRFIHRHQAYMPWGLKIKGALGAALGIGLCAFVTNIYEVPLLIAPFGASCVLLFNFPQSPLSQPAHVVGGHILATGIALLLRSFLPNEWYFIALSVGLIVLILSWLRMAHPPAGADPIVVFIDNPSWDFIFLPVGLGSIMLILIAIFTHNLPPKTLYPLKP